MTRVLAIDENNRTLSVTVTNIGEGGVGLTTNINIGEDGVGLTTKKRLAIGSIVSFQVPLPGFESDIHIQARVLWTREYGAVGCEFVRIPPGDLQVLHAWLEGKYRFKKPSFPI
jgi:hypothetical protein